MKETMEASLADALAAEEKDLVGNLGVEIETMKGDLSDTAQSMIEDKKFLADLDKTCAARSAMMNFLPWQTQSRCTTMTMRLNFSRRPFQALPSCCRPR